MKVTSPFVDRKGRPQPLPRGTSPGDRDTTEGCDAATLPSSLGLLPYSVWIHQIITSGGMHLCHLPGIRGNCLLSSFLRLGRRPHLRARWCSMTNIGSGVTRDVDYNLGNAMREILCNVLGYAHAALRWRMISLAHKISAHLPYLVAHHLLVTRRGFSASALVQTGVPMCAASLRGRRRRLCGARPNQASTVRLATLEAPGRGSFSLATTHIHLAARVARPRYIVRLWSGDIRQHGAWDCVSIHGQPVRLRHVRATITEPCNFPQTSVSLVHVRRTLPIPVSTQTGRL